MVLPLVVFSSERNRLVNTLAGALVIYMLYSFVLADSVDKFVENYIKAIFVAGCGHSGGS